jgi:hypothetical protein
MRLPPRSRPGWELIAVGTILVLYIIANVVIVRLRPAMMRTALASVDSALTRDRGLLGRELVQWRDGMLDDGRWAANLVGLIVETHPPKPARVFSAADAARLRSLTIAQIPTARVWIFDTHGIVRGATDPDEPSARHRWLARTSLARDTTLLAATEQRGPDLRLAVGSPVRTASGRGLTVVLDLSAADRLRRRVPSLALAGHAVRAAVTFPFGNGYVGATWTGTTDSPRIGWPENGWSLTDSSLIVMGGSLPDTSAHFELGVPRATAQALVETRAAWLHAGAALTARLPPRAPDSRRSRPDSIRIFSRTRCIRSRHSSPRIRRPPRMHLTGSAICSVTRWSSRNAGRCRSRPSGDF